MENERDRLRKENDELMVRAGGFHGAWSGQGSKRCGHTRVPWLRPLMGRLRPRGNGGKLMLKQVQDGLLVNDEVLAKSNSLFVVNGKSNIIRDAPAPMPVQRTARATVQVAATAQESSPLAM